MRFGKTELYLFRIKIDAGLITTHGRDGGILLVRAFQLILWDWCGCVGVQYCTVHQLTSPWFTPRTGLSLVRQVCRLSSYWSEPDVWSLVRGESPAVWPWLWVFDSPCRPGCCTSRLRQDYFPHLKNLLPLLSFVIRFMVRTARSDIK